MNEQDTIKKFAGLCYAFTKENNQWFFWRELLESYKEEDYLILKEKITNLYTELNKNDKDWLPKDIETEIYFMI